MGRRKSNSWDTRAMNNRTYLHYYERLYNLSINMYKWSGLPDTIDERFLEMCLFYDGMCVFFKDDGGLGYLALQCMIGGELTVYRIPMWRTAYASNGYQMRLNNQNSVIIFNNFAHTNSLLGVEMYARRLYEIERAIDVNVKAQKTPTLIRATEAQRLTMKNLYSQYDGNEPFIFADKNFNPTDITVLRTDAPFVATELNILLHQKWNEALTSIGIENSNMDKRERSNLEEVQSSNGGVVAERLVKLNARRQGAEQINKMFGLDIWCDFNEDLLYLPISESEVRRGGEIYDRSQGDMREQNRTDGEQRTDTNE